MSFLDVLRFIRCFPSVSEVVKVAKYCIYIEKSFGILDGELERGSIKQFYRNVDTVGAGDGFKARIDVLSVEETVAVVRVLEEKWGGRIEFTDYLLMLKLNGEWKCVAKSYNQNSDTIKK